MKLFKWFAGLSGAKKLLTVLVVGATIAGVGTVVKDKKTPEHTHSYTQQTTLEATCMTKGVMTYTCSCNDTYTEEIPALGHIEKRYEGHEATCLEIGWEPYVICERGCGYTTYKILGVTGVHAWDDGIITLEPTCVAMGVKTFTCTVCAIATYTEEIPMLAHDIVQHDSQAATCTEIGWEAYETCSYCAYTTYAETPALDHDRVQHGAKAATCMEIGWDAYETCNRCEYTTYVERPTTSEHVWDKGTETKAPTCTKEGEKTYLCTVCKKVTKTEPIGKVAHEYGSAWAYNETHHYHACQCGDKVDEVKHSPSAPATATTKQTCTVCGYVIQDETGILFNTLSVDDTKVYGKVSNATTEFSFINEVLIKGNATYIVDNDKDCNSPIASKTVDLSVGDNVFYVLESAGNNVKLYVVTIRRRPMYEVTFNTNGGTVAAKQIVEEDSLAVEPETSKLGYTLAGWDYDFTLPITKSTHITAIWDANNGTKYVVNYYLQNIFDYEYTLFETDELKGVTNTLVEAVVKDYQHFTYNQGKSTTKGVVNPDGSLVLNVYYTRNSYTAQVGTEVVNGSSLITQTRVEKYGVELTCTTGLVAGYTFLGWYDGANLVTTDTTFVFIVEKDVVYMARLQANNNTKYTVNYYCQNLEDDEYTLYDTQELVGTTDTTAEATIYQYNHFTYNESMSTVSGNINGDGSLVLNVYYTRNVYTVQAGYYFENVSSAITQVVSYKYGLECTASVTLMDGYTWLGWYEYDGAQLHLASTSLSFAFMVEKDVVYYQCWRVNNDTRYTVNYYLQNIDNNDYTLYETDWLAGTTDTFVNAEIKQYPHFTYNKNISTTSGSISGDGNLVLSVYYTRDSYTVATNGNDGNAGTYTKVNNQYRYDKEITLTAITNTCYTWLGWYEDGNLVCATEKFTFKVTKDVTYTATWLANTDTKYTVIYYWQNLDDNDYTPYETVEVGGMTDTLVEEVDIREYAHFTYNASKSVTSGVIKGDGSLVLHVYYTRNTYSLSNNNASTGSITRSGTYKYGKEVTSTVTAHLGYDFVGWYSGETLLSTDTTYSFTVTQNVTVSFEVKEEMSTFNFTSGTTTCSITKANDKTATKVTIPDYVTAISRGAFIGYSNLQEITLPFVGEAKAGTGATYFGYIFGAMSYSENEKQTPASLKKVTITSTTTIAKQAFYHCVGLTNVVIPNGVTSIAADAFSGCKALTSMVIPDSVRTIGEDAFYNCDGLLSVDIGDGVTSIGEWAFYNCSRLTSVVISDNVQSIGYQAFGNCSRLTSVVIGDSVTSIGEWVFYNCTNLTSVVIGKNVTSIGDYAFYCCDSLTNVYYKGMANISIGSYNNNLTNATKYYYSENPPMEAGNFWHYDGNGKVVVWTVA